MIQTVKVKGKSYVLVPPAEWKRLQRLVKANASSSAAQTLPPYPPADAAGNRPAVESVTVSIARKIILRRNELGLTQAELARLAGMRQETICRLESGKHSSTVRTLDRIEKALNLAAKKITRGKRTVTVGSVAEDGTRRNSKKTATRADHSQR